MDESKPDRRSSRPQTLEEEWDDPAMIAILRQQAEDRVEFARSLEREDWARAMKNRSSMLETFTVAPAPKEEFRERVITLPW